MKIIVEDGSYAYSVDWATENRIDGGWLKEYHPSIEEVLDAVIHLLGCVYPEEGVEEAIRKGVL